MLKKTPDSIQYDIFGSASNMLTGKTLNIFESQTAWHNVFREKITKKIDEHIFAPLYTDNTGRPNASIRVLVAMMILKESAGISDSKLYEDCRFNMLYRSALGLVNTNDAIPVESTYYLFRKNIVRYEQEHGINLMEKVFSEITKNQCLDFGVSGQSIRMDSKLLGSNIANLTRFELIFNVLKHHYVTVDNKKGLNKTSAVRLEQLLKEESKKIIFTSTASKVKSLIVELGRLIFNVLKLKKYQNQESFLNLKRLFEDQYTIAKDGTITPKSKEEISAKSIQSPHDSDCTYRYKGGKNGMKKQEVKGYSANVTETCDDNSLNLITDVKLETASTSDVNFFQPAIQASQEILTTKIKNIHSDGGYYSPDNHAFCNNNDIDLHVHAIQGYKGRYDLVLLDDDTLRVIDTHTGEEIKSKKITTAKAETKWRIPVTQGKFRYFTEKEVIACRVRKEIEQTPIEISQKRNNVEATIFQLGYHCSNSKSKYRGLTRVKMWANVRCMWINFVRILKNIREGLCPFVLASFLIKLYAQLWAMMSDKPKFWARIQSHSLLVRI